MKYCILLFYISHTHTQIYIWPPKNKFLALSLYFYIFFYSHIFLKKTNNIIKIILPNTPSQLIVESCYCPFFELNPFSFKGTKNSFTYIDINQVMTNNARHHYLVIEKIQPT